MSETSKSVLIKIFNGISFWVPKRFIDSSYSKKEKVEKKILNFD